jgi:short-subunit dehydrogenase
MVQARPVLAFTRSLHHELGNKGIRVQAVLSAAAATEFWGMLGEAFGKEEFAALAAKAKAAAG